MFFTVGKFTYISIKMVSQNQEFVASIPENETSELDSLSSRKPGRDCPLPRLYVLPPFSVLFLQYAPDLFLKLGKIAGFDHIAVGQPGGKVIFIT